MGVMMKGAALTSPAALLYYCDLVQLSMPMLPPRLPKEGANKYIMITLPC